jgi:hypothetical protein
MAWREGTPGQGSPHTKTETWRVSGPTYDLWQRRKVEPQHHRRSKYQKFVPIGQRDPELNNRQTHPVCYNYNMIV